MDLGAKQLTLSAGLSAGLAEGAEFVIYPRTETDVSQLDTRKAWVRLTRVGDIESDAEIVELFGSEAPEPGDQGVLVGAATQALVRNVRLVRRDLKPLTAHDTALAAIKKALPGNGWVELVEGPERSASFVVRLSEDGAHYEVGTPDYEPIRLNPPLAVADKRSPQALVRRLVHLAKYQAVLELENNTPGAVLQKKKVLATVKPTSFRPSRLPPLDEPIPSTSSDAGRNRGTESDPLEQLLEAVGADQPPSRDASAVARPGREWASAKVQVRIQEKPS